MGARTDLRIHRHRSRPEGADVNAYLVETRRGLVAIDGTLTVSDARDLRRRADALGKPLLAVLVTHAHPDHYGGLTELVADLAIPIVAAKSVEAVIRRDDAIKETILRPMFGGEWPEKRIFPNQTLDDGEDVTFDEVRFTLVDLGPGESPADSMWVVDGGDDVFPGDVVYDHKHCYLADGFWREWLANIDRLQRELPPGATLHIGHGEPASSALFGWQRGYIESFVQAIEDADWSDLDRARSEVVAKAKSYLRNDELDFLMILSIEPVAAKLGSIPAAH